jgi:hypothetical protein
MASLRLLGATSLIAVAMVSSGCSNSDPVKAEANVVTGGLTQGNTVQVTAALASSSAAVKGWQIENGALPTTADFATIPGAASSGGATVTYVPAGSGFCLTATSSGQPAVVRVWREPGGLQPEGATC